MNTENFDIGKWYQRGDIIKAFGNNPEAPCNAVQIKEGDHIRYLQLRADINPSFKSSYLRYLQELNLSEFIYLGSDHLSVMSRTEKLRNSESEFPVFINSNRSIPIEGFGIHGSQGETYHFLYAGLFKVIKEEHNTNKLELYYQYSFPLNMKPGELISEKIINYVVLKRLEEAPLFKKFSYVEIPHIDTSSLNTG